jgi:hypothetical protein
VLPEFEAKQLKKVTTPQMYDVGWGR